MASSVKSTGRVDPFPAFNHDIFNRIPDDDDRMYIWEQCELEPDLRKRAAFRDACIQKCREDKTWFINAFLHTLDPRKTDGLNDLPFLLWPIQIDWLEKLDQAAGFVAGIQPHSLVCEKSRDLGFSYTTLAWFFYHWRFTPGFKGLVGSRKEEYVDDFTETSLFGKFDYFIDTMPGWLMPENWSRRKHRRERKLSNPENGNILQGEATNANFGRGGRFRAILFDEAAFWYEPAPLERAWSACSRSTNCRIAVSTPDPQNPQNFFFTLRNRFADIGRLFTAPWYSHPERDEAWLELQKVEATDSELRYEILLSYEVSPEGLVYPGWPDVMKGAYPYPRDIENWELYCSWDFGIKDTSIIWWARHRHTQRLRMLDSYQGHNKPLDYYVPLVTGTLPADWPHLYGPAEQRKIAEHHTWGQPIHYGDPAGAQRNQTDGKSPFDFLAEHGIYLLANPAANSHADRKRFTELGLRRLEVNAESCIQVDMAMLNYRYKPRRNGADPSGPEHDWSSHFATAVEFFFVCEARFASRDVRALPKPKRTKRAYESLVRR